MSTLSRYKTFILAIFAFIFVATLSFLLSSHPEDTSAANLNNFSAGNIISDYAMENSATMSRDDIQNFLRSKVSCSDYDLRKEGAGGYNWEWIDQWDESTGIHFNYKIHFRYWRNGEWYYTSASYHVEDGHYVCIADERFHGQSAADVIYEVAQNYRINPQVLLVLLQKEQGLITDQLPNAGQYRSATGYGCPDTDVCDSQYYGFKNQLENAAALFRHILDNGSRYKPVGNNYVQYNPNAGCGGSTVYIENRATSALYQYTPYQPNQAALGAGYGIGDECSAYGNRNFYLYFSDWFGDTHASVDIQSIYPASGTYTLKTTSKKVLGFSGTTNGSVAEVASDTGSNLQKFTLEHDKDKRYYRLRNVATGKYLDVSGASTNDGATVQLWDGNDTCAQKWSLEIVSSTSYKLRNACSYKSLDVNGANINTNGTKIQIWTSNDTDAQRWLLTNNDPAAVEDGTYNITTTGHKAVALSLEDTANGTKLVTGDIHSARTEQFQLTHSQDGYYRVKNLASNRSLDVNGASDHNGATVQIYDDNISCAQRWAIQRNKDGYSLMSACSGKSLDVNNANISTENTKIQIWTPNNSTAQIWQFSQPIGRTIPDGVYELESKLNSDYVLDADGSKSPFDGTNIQLWRRNNTDSQKYTITYNDSTGYYTIKNAYTGRNLDVNGASKSSGANIQAWSENDTCAQKWMIIPDNNSYYRIISSCSRLSLDANGGLAGNGTNIQLWSRNDSPAQKWKFNQTSIAPTDELPDGTYNIQSAINNNYALDLNGALANNGTNIQLWKTNSTCAQKWQFTKISDNTYRITSNCDATYALDLNGALAGNGTNIQLWKTNSTCAQKWQVQKTSNGNYTLTSACNSNYSLDANGALASNGTNIQLWKTNSTLAQQWKITK